MSVRAMSHRPAVITSAGPLDAASAPAFPAWLGRATGIVSDVLALAIVVFCIPFVILGVGIPIALFLQLVLWIGQML